MGIQNIEFGVFLKNKSNKDPKQTMPMMSMTVIDYAKLRTGEITLLDFNLFKMPPD